MFSVVANAVFAKSAHKTSAPRSVTITGTLESQGSDYVIKTGKATYKVVGEDFGPMVGHKVKATGAPVKGEKGKVLDISKVQELKAK
jgi:uncharacterized OB-fold protein